MALPVSNPSQSASVVLRCIACLYQGQFSGYIAIAKISAGAQHSISQHQRCLDGGMFRVHHGVVIADPDIRCL